MQTFLPENSFTRSAKSLDYRRLGKQRVEVLQLLKCIQEIKDGGSPRGWANHPCRKMWQNYQNALVLYGLCICREWLNRGYNDTCADKIFKYFNKNEKLKLPPFFNDTDFHNSHKSVLIQKDQQHYQHMWSNISNTSVIDWNKYI
jgi:hypothetical protein